MRVFWDERQRRHAPAQELHNGAFVPFAEHCGRIDSMLAALGATEAVADHGEAPLLRVHPRAYLDFLGSAFADWKAAGRPGDASGYIWPVVGRRPLDLDRIDARLGQYSLDASTPIAEGTWESAYWAAQTALSGLDAVLAGESAAFALCRPPGHHAGADYMGGYCYLNNAAIAAEAGIAAGRGRVAILDVDYHHGNGTQDIFWRRGDVLFASIHADPRTDYPFSGPCRRSGAGEGEGTNLNLPLPRGTALRDYEAALDRALEAIAGFGAGLLVCSFGADTFAGDPICSFALETADYAPVARRIARWTCRPWSPWKAAMPSMRSARMSRRSFRVSSRAPYARLSGPSSVRFVGGVVRISYTRAMKIRLPLAALLAMTCSQPGHAAPAKSAPLAIDRPETQASATFSLTSRDFSQGGEIPVQFSDYGNSISPSLAWSGLPGGTKSVAVVMEDSSTAKPFVHWVAWNLDPAAGRLDRGSVTFGARLGRNGRGNPAYFGPRPTGKAAHQYHFQFFALDTQLSLKAGASRDQLLAAMNGHVLAKADLVGLFAQPKGR